ncbi:MAG: UDP-N-acetylglucosamine 1-carboxyvinyltransferase [Candidatus Tectomicrobia bacterium]|uniref:UDP-N-acetylglucosamine 1-carboxyvinyltransferase n=1 Tax=Tectimicrobiota bacterium TaxID=2528274 RepID=A0A938B451_UNCTE|nr:UDP-N-acetylglucosamine 1-carboxyvinyltransferase [Candidatus Tectomicrobia bacterium]
MQTDTWTIEGGVPLRGEVRVSGAKNSITKLMVASMLTSEPCVLHNTPHIGESQITRAICEALGAEFKAIPPRTLQVQTTRFVSSEIPSLLGSHNRLAIMTVAPLLHRTGQAIVPIAAGGDRIGPRPVNFHLEGYRRLGAHVEVRDEAYYIKAERLYGAEIVLPYPSVTTTENLLLAATVARGRTFLRNVAIEPEIMDLVICLQKMGAIIDYNADRTFVIEGVQTLYGMTHDIMPDRIVAASLACAAVASGGDVFVHGARQVDMVTFLNALRRVGGKFAVAADGIRFYREGPLKSIASETNVHPGFMTDWQPPFVLLLTQAEGMSVVHETVFEDRFGYVAELQKMGADIALYDACLGGASCRFHSSNYRHSCVIKGPARLRGSHITVPDLRAGFTYLIAAALAQGQSTIEGLSHIERGYENLEDSLRRLGVHIRKEPSR